MKTGVLLTALLLCSCGGNTMHGDRGAAQRLVEQIAAEHPGLVRLTLHAVPTGETENIIIACNVAEKIGAISDPEDLLVMTTRQPVVLNEDDAVDITMPILDKAGEVIAAAGITLKNDGSTSDEALMNEAEAIARELTEAVLATSELPW